MTEKMKDTRLAVIIHTHKHNHIIDNTGSKDKKKGKGYVTVKKME